MRPILTMRPGFLTFNDPRGSGMRHYPADTHLLAWLEAKGFDFDIITDEDLDDEGVALLAAYRTVLTGSHPGISHAPHARCADAYTQPGGRLCYLGGNGFYWRVARDKAMPGLIEIRRAEGGIRTWAGRAGRVLYHQTDGQLGGLWRRNRRPPQMLVGVGFSCQGRSRAPTTVACRPRASSTSPGCSTASRTDVLGDYGLSGGGAAGFELDRADPMLGTPDDAVILARSENPPASFFTVPEEMLSHVSTVNGEPTEDLKRGEIVYFETPLRRRRSSRSARSPSAAACGRTVASRGRSRGCWRTWSAAFPLRDGDARQRSTASFAEDYKLPVEDLDFLLRDEVRDIRFALEYAKAELLLRDWGIRSTVIIFGSARTPSPEQAEAAMAAAATDVERTHAQRMLQRSSHYTAARETWADRSERGGAFAPHDRWRDNVIATGGGPGIMEAANRSALDAGAPSIGYNITLPKEQQPNPYSTPELTFQFHYFAMRKMHLAMRANALVVFPGGFGTMDELFEILTLEQTRKAPAMPIVLFDQAYWRRMVNFDALLEEDVIEPADLALFEFADTPEAAWQAIASRGLKAHTP